MNRRQTLLGAAALAGCGPAAGAAPAFPMRRGINFGNALEAPSEGEWGYRIEPAHLDAIARVGFDGVRLPVRWDTHVGARPPYVIAPEFLARVSEIVIAALDRGLKVQLDVHHDQTLLDAPERERARFLATWRQIARHFRSAPDQLMFEPLNEANGAYWNGAAVSALQAAATREIRATNPHRLIVLGGPNWNSIDGLYGWTPPPDLQSAVTVHYYAPYAFTHQDAEWLGAGAPNFARAWGSDDDIRTVQAHTERAADWAGARGLALQLGEFGANQRLSLAQRVLWTRTVREAFERVGAGWCAWDFAGAFAIWDRKAQRFIPELVEALLH